MAFESSLEEMTSKPRKWSKRLFRTKSRRRKAISMSIVAGNVALLAIVISIVGVAHEGSADTPISSNVHLSASQLAANPLDQVSSAAIAETVAGMSGLAETTAIANQADSEATSLDTPPSTSTVITQPAVITTANNYVSNKDIRTYTAVAGDTITSIAAKFNVTSDSIRWSNGISGDGVAVGTKLYIPPVSGIVYTVAAGDTPASLAAKYKADANKIIGFNNAEISGLTVGTRIIIPDGSIAVAPVVTLAASASKWSGTASYGYNGYDYGYCTWWVATLRAKAGSPVPSNLGNAATWAVRAAGMGLSTGSTPQVGAAVVTSTRGAGHVAYVTAVNGDGTITISEMNHAGWNVTDTRSIPVSDSYRYIY